MSTILTREQRIDELRLRAKLFDTDDIKQYVDDSWREYDRARFSFARIEFGSFHDFLSSLKSTELDPSMRSDIDDIEEEDGPSYVDGWTTSKVVGIRDREHLNAIVERGYPTESLYEFYLEKKRRLFSNPDNLAKLGAMGADTRRKRRRDLAGCIINLDKAMAGLDPMESIKRRSMSRAVRIFIDLARLAHVQPEHIIEASSYAIAVSKQLEEKGYAVEIAIGTTNIDDSGAMRRKSIFRELGLITDDTRQLIHALKIVVKRPDEPLHEGQLLALSNSAIFRDYIFSFRRNFLEQNIGASLYTEIRPSNNEKFYRHFADCDVYVGHNDSLETIVTGVSGVLI